MSTIQLRSYQPADAVPLLALFRRTVRQVNARDYHAVQIAAWASDEIDPIAWAARFDNRFAIVAERDGLLAGFADLTLEGFLDRFFVAADHQRCGVGRRLWETIVAWGREQRLTSITTAASLTAEPFFRACGFHIEAPQTVVCRGVEFQNYRMSYRFDVAQEAGNAACD
jgi:putative acetyltransferase